MAETVKTNYVQDVIDRLADRLDDCDGDLLALYALLTLTTGEATSLRNVHDAWAAWRNVTNPAHKSLVPFEDLTPEVQAYDEKYRAAIVDVALELADERAWDAF